MNQSGYVSQTLWQYRVASQFTDVTLVCADDRLSAHAALLSGFLSGFGISLGDAPHVLLLPDVASKEIEAALREIYRDYSSKCLSEALSTRDIFIEEAEKYPIVEDDPKNKIQISGVKGDIHDSKFDNKYSNDDLGKCMNTKLQDLDGKYSDVLDPSELDVLSEMENIGEFCKKEEDLGGFFQSTQNLDTHKNKNKKIKKYCNLRCKKCDVSFSGRKYLLEHRKEVHGYKYIPKEYKIKIRRSKCVYCIKVLKPTLLTSHMALKHREETLSNHPEIVHQFQVPCPDCDEMFLRDQLDLSKHRKEVHANSMIFELKRYRRNNKCKLCYQLFDKNRDLIRHRHEKHPEEYLDMGMKMKNMQCPYCEKLLYLHYFASHIFNMHKEKRILHPEIVAEHTCGSCDEQFILSQHLREHEKKVHTSPATCLLCSKLCPNEFSLERHTYVVHKKAGSNVCEYCSKGFNHKRDLREHVNCMHLGISKQFKYKCNLCLSGKYQTEESLQKHMLDDHSGVKYLCDQCPLSFTNTILRSHHIVRNHKEKTMKCDQCDMWFSTKGLLGIHLDSVHLKTRRKTCEVCGETFNANDIGSFTAHINRHNNVRPYSCNECGKDFLSRQGLQKHSGVHTRPLQCDQCEKKCASSSQLKRHIQKIHLGIMHDCRYGCGWHTPLDSNRIRHEKQCRSNPIPGAPWSVSNGTANRYVLQTFQASKR